MKKTYIKPVVTAVSIRTSSQMLTVSGYGGPANAPSLFDTDFDIDVEPSGEADELLPVEIFK